MGGNASGGLNGGGGNGGDRQPPDDAELRSRVASLEAGRQDLSAWATMLVGIVAVLFAANVGLSVWQVGSISRREADNVIGEYDRRFNGFLTTGEETIREALAHSEQRFSELSARIKDVSASVESVSPVAREALAAVHAEIHAAVERFHAEGEQLRTRVERELQEYHAAQLQNLEKRFAKKSGGAST